MFDPSTAWLSVVTIASVPFAFLAAYRYLWVLFRSVS